MVKNNKYEIMVDNITDDINHEVQHYMSTVLDSIEIDDVNIELLNEFQKSVTRCVLREIYSRYAVDIGELAKALLSKDYEDNTKF